MIEFVTGCLHVFAHSSTIGAAIGHNSALSHTFSSACMYSSSWRWYILIKYLFQTLLSVKHFNIFIVVTRPFASSNAQPTLTTPLPCLVLDRRNLSLFDHVNVGSRQLQQILLFWFSDVMRSQVQYFCFVYVIFSCRPLCFSLYIVLVILSYTLDILFCQKAHHEALILGSELFFAPSFSS